MRQYVPKFDKEDKGLIILYNLFDAEACVEYAKKHNMKVLMSNTTSTSSVEVIMLFQKNGFSIKLYEEDVYAPDGIKLSPKVLCLFEKKQCMRLLKRFKDKKVLRGCRTKFVKATVPFFVRKFSNLFSLFYIVIRINIFFTI